MSVAVAERDRAVSDWGGGIRALAGLVVLLLTLTLAATASAATLTVNRTDDVDHVPFATNECMGAPNDCSLRQALYNAAGTGDTIIVPSGTYTLTLGQLDVLGPMTISGAGARTTTINRTSTAHRIFAIEGSGEVDVSGLTVSDGNTSGDTSSAFGACGGGGFYVNTGVTLALSDTTVSNNTADCSTGGTGGGIYVNGTLTLNNTTITGNTANSCGEGGALYTFGGTINATNSTISGNDSECSGGAHGGGIVVIGPSSLTLRNVTLASNSDTVGSDVNVGANLAMEPSGGPTFPTVSIQDTVIADGVPAADGNCGTDNSGPIPAISVGHNISDDATCGFTASGDQQNVNPLLGALADNGGQTDTRALLAGSPAIDAGDNTGCPATDQRGVSRPQDGNGDGTAICDVGAYELAAPMPSGGTGGTGGTGATGGTGGQPGAPPPTTKPAISGLAASPKTFSVAGRRVAGKCVKPTANNNGDPRCRRAIKLKVSYKLSVADIVTFTLTRQAPGRKVNGRCVKQTTENRNHPRCTRLIAVPGKVSKTGMAGANSFIFNGKIGGHTLGPGIYQLTATPTGDTAHKVTFTIVG